MTDEEARDVALRKWVAQRAQMAPSQRRPPVSASFYDGFSAGLAHARAWLPLTEDPATWPEEGQWVSLRSAAVKDDPDLQRWFARRRSQATRCSSWARQAHWTHWAPLPAPPEVTK